MTRELPEGVIDFDAKRTQRAEETATPLEFTTQDTRLQIHENVLLPDGDVEVTLSLEGETCVMLVKASELNYSFQLFTLEEYVDHVLSVEQL